MRTTPIQKAIRATEQKFRDYEKARDRERVLAEVRRLEKAGVTRNTIAELMHMTPRNVERILGGVVCDVTAPAPHKFDQSPNNVAKLERTLESTVELACRLRDEDPGFIYEVGQTLDRQSLIEMWMVSLAAMPIDKPRSEIFAWIEELGARA